MLEDRSSVDLEPRLDAALDTLEILALRPWELDLEPMRATSASDAEIDDAIAVGALFAGYVRVADALDFDAPSARERRMIGKHGYRRGYARGSLEPGEQPRWSDAFADLERDVIDGGGVTSAALRRDVIDRVADYVASGDLDTADLPEPVATFLEVATRHAYRLTDAHVDALVRHTGDPEGAFELIIAAAVGSAVARYRRLR